MAYTSLRFTTMALYPGAARACSQVEMHAFHQHVGGHHLMQAFGVDHGRIIADTLDR
jgi:hypothetical protein